MANFHFYQDLFYVTLTVNKWKKLFLNDEVNNIILSTFRYLKQNNKCIIYSFVIMPNHIHLIYQILPPNEESKVKHSFKSFTSNEISKILGKSEINNLGLFNTNKEVQIWKSPSLSVELFSPKFVSQKMNYIHDNPRKAGLCDDNSSYNLCSYKSYELGESQFDFLTLF